ncbi:uncharacterized protein BCR38DRAFT_415949 [Pseudomassariella vexata]|uniref:Secreted protein n=1 Tax=Pseudomassariella vexata TaxID=1141098 RepID=A0A1Y2EHQ7_9PEZI|nr:uncharacterized protein BCR38DRAFT_415949 [Pseudomassariella vexata]ORY71111.1 hypothetical protein BCR38DRAFT_415949 [Pseudomassariella vexata]
MQRILVGYSSLHLFFCLLCPWSSVDPRAEVEDEEDAGTGFWFKLSLLKNKGGRTGSEICATPAHTPSASYSSPSCCSLMDFFLNLFLNLFVSSRLLDREPVELP